MQNEPPSTRRIAPDVRLGQNVIVCDFVNLYGCEIGDNSRIGTFVEVQEGARIGRNCKIQSHTFICEGVTIADDVFIGHNVTFINDRFPRAVRADGGLQTDEDWVCLPTLVKSGASIGSSVTILCGVTIGENALVGAGSVVTKDVPAGAVVTNNAELAEKIHMLRDHGQSEKHQHAVIGWNDRMDGLQGAVLSIKLKHLDHWNDARRERAGFYDELLEDLPHIVLPREASYARHVFHIYAVRVPHRDRLLAILHSEGIGCGIHYPVPIHLQRAYEFLGHAEGSFPVAEQSAREVLSLSMYPELTIGQLETVTDALASLLRPRDFAVPTTMRAS